MDLLLVFTVFEFFALVWLAYVTVFGFDGPSPSFRSARTLQCGATTHPTRSPQSSRRGVLESLFRGFQCSVSVAMFFVSWLFGWTAFGETVRRKQRLFERNARTLAEVKQIMDESPQKAKGKFPNLRVKAAIKQGLLQKHWLVYFETVMKTVRSCNGNLEWDQVLDAMVRMREKFRNYARVNERTNNNRFYGYSGMDSRLGFLTLQVPKHAAIIQEAFRASRAQVLERIALARQENRRFVVTSIGGGPTSELIGLLGFLEDVALTDVEVDYYVLDFGDWQSFWPVVEELVSAEYGSRVRVFFQKGNATKMDILEDLPIGQTDVFVFSYFLVEMHPYGQEFRRVFVEMVRRVSDGCLFMTLESPYGSARRTFCNALFAAAKESFVVEKCHIVSTSGMIPYWLAGFDRVTPVRAVVYKCLEELPSLLFLLRIRGRTGGENGTK